MILPTPQHIALLLCTLPPSSLRHRYRMASLAAKQAREQSAWQEVRAAGGEEGMGRGQAEGGE